MEVTDVKLRKIDSDGRMKAIVSITLDGEFAVHDLRVIEGNTGLFVAMPSKKNNSGEFKDVAHPISKVLRDKITSKVLSEYGYVESETTINEVKL